MLLRAKAVLTVLTDGMDNVAEAERFLEQGFRYWRPRILNSSLPTTVTEPIKRGLYKILLEKLKIHRTASNRGLKQQLDLHFDFIQGIRDNRFELQADDHYAQAFLEVVTVLATISKTPADDITPTMFRNYSKYLTAQLDMETDPDHPFLCFLADLYESMSRHYLQFGNIGGFLVCGMISIVHETVFSKGLQRDMDLEEKYFKVVNLLQQSLMNHRCNSPGKLTTILNVLFGALGVMTSCRLLTCFRHERVGRSPDADGVPSLQNIAYNRFRRRDSYSQHIAHIR